MARTTEGDGAWDYGRLLRTLGTYLNDQQARYLVLEERGEKFVWRYAVDGDPTRVAHGDSGFAAMLALDGSYRHTLRARSGLLGRGARSRGTPHPLARHPLLPEGYSRVLRALGIWLDRRQSRLLSLEEYDDRLEVRYTRISASPDGPATGQARAQVQVFRRETIQALVEAARGLRGRPDLA